MMNQLPYTSSIKDMPFLFAEMRRTAQLLCEGKTSEEIVQLSMDSNIYQLEREKRRRDVPLRMIKRLETVSSQLVEIIAVGRESDAKVIAFLSLVKADQLLFEFMLEVFADKYHAGYKEITDKDYLEFIERKAQNSDVVAKWTANNLVRIRNTYKNILCEAGLSKRVEDHLLIHKPIIDPSLRNHIGPDDLVYAQAILLED